MHPVQSQLNVGVVLPFDPNDDPEKDELEVEPVVPPQVSTHGGARPQTQGFAASTAASTGMTKQAINRHIARADALGDDVQKQRPHRGEAQSRYTELQSSLCRGLFRGL